MKTKKLSKKLTLQKQTITNLRNGEMNDAKGGIDLSAISYCVGCPTILTCDTCAPYTCACGLDTYETCNYYMCNTLEPFPCI